MKPIYFLFLLTLNLHIHAQEESMSNTPDHVLSIDGVVNEALKIISSSERDWEAFRYLFTADATLSVLNHGKEGMNRKSSFTVEAFVRMGKKNFAKDGSFSETEIKKVIQEYNGIATVFQSYVVRVSDREEKGINSYQLIHDGKRWWISSLLWTNDRNGVTVPEEWLE